MVIETLFWVSLFLFFHTWVGYPLMLMLITSGKARSPEFPVEQEVPFVSVVIAAYNAAGKIEGKLKNTLALDYPGDKLEVIVVSDGSTDDTGLKAKSLNESNVFIHELERNQGKSSAQNYGVQRARGEIIVFTDVDAQLDRGFLLNIVSYFSDSSVACAGGRAIYMRQEGSISASQALYWRLEQFIKKAESDLGVLISLSGWGFAVRKRDFVPLDPDTGDDMILPLEMSLRGKRSVFAPNAVVRDTMPSTF